MLATILLASAFLATDPATPSSPSASTTTNPDRQAYDAAVSRIGRGPDAQINLALWCEAHGLEVERLKHLSLAALADPTNARARALMGIVSEAGRWGRPEAIAARIKTDAALSAVRAQYEALRNQTKSDADDQWKLARWCEQNGLKAEATAHDTAVTRLDPTREAAWKKLGCIKFEGRWMTPEQVETLKADRDAQLAADRKWKPLVEKWKVWLTKSGRQADLEAAFSGVNDPWAVSSIAKAFVTSSARDQAIAIRLFGQIDSTDASRRLAVLAVFGATEELRRKAIETLRKRDVRGALEPVIMLLRDPIKYVAIPHRGPGAPGVVQIEGKRATYNRVYEDPNYKLWEPLNTQLEDALRRTEKLISDTVNQKLFEDIQALEATNFTIAMTNKNALIALRGITGKDFDLDRNAWMAWWTDQKGYAFQAEMSSTNPADKMVYNDYVDSYPLPRHSCFVAGTPVQTIDGSRRIEDLKIGDRILTQDTTTGLMTYQPILNIFHNAPAHTLRVRLGGETIVATGIHRFWKAGHGWAMLRDLKVGDSIRLLDGVAKVESIESDRIQPVFNLEVARGTSFFVGEKGTLVHDNSLVQSVEKPFDATPELASSEVLK